MKRSIAVVTRISYPNLAEHDTSASPNPASLTELEDNAAEEAYFNEGGKQSSGQTQQLVPDGVARIMDLLYLSSRTGSAPRPMHSCTFSVKAAREGGFIDSFEINDQCGRVLHTWSAHASSPMQGLAMACAKPVEPNPQIEA